MAYKKQQFVSIFAVFCLMVSCCGCMNSKIQTDIKTDLVEPFESINNSISERVPFMLAPFLTPVVAYNVSSFEFINVIINNESASLFSSRIAISFWNSCNKIYLVDSYEDAMRASSLAVMDSCPILLFGNTSNYVIQTLKPSEIIGIGNINSELCSQILHNSTEIMEYCIDNKLPICGYISVVNVCSSDPASVVAPFINGLHNGFLIPVKNGNPETIHDQIYLEIKTLKDAGIIAQYVTLFGGPGSIEHYETDVVLHSSNGESKEKRYTDNYYGSINEDNMTHPDLAVGRIIASDPKEAMELYWRYKNYANLLQDDWKDKSVIVNSDAIMEADVQTGILISLIKNTLIFENAGYSTYSSDAVATEAFAQTLSEKIQDSNLIYSIRNTDSDGIMSFSDESSLKPCVVFDCTEIQSSLINDLKSKQYQLLGAGANAYIAPLLSSWYGTTSPISTNLSHTRVLEEADSLELAKIFFGELIDGDNTVGIALRNAKQTYIQEWYEPMNIYVMVSLSFILYGDPAFNPYEPCNEGAGGP
jgi:hypothetical protein